MRYNNIIFDLDGTLIDSMHIWEDLGFRFLKKKRKEPEKDLSKKIETMTLNESALYFITEYKLNMTIEEIIKDINQLASDSYMNDSNLKKGANKFIHKCNCYNYNMGIVTAMDEELAIDVLNKFNLLKNFRFIITELNSGYSKSDSEIFKLALKKINGNKHNTLVIEDSYHSIKAAKKVGLDVAAIYDKSQIKEQNKIKKISDYYIHNFNELKIFK